MGDLHITRPQPGGVAPGAVAGLEVRFADLVDGQRLLVEAREAREPRQRLPGRPGEVLVAELEARVPPGAREELDGEVP